MGDTRSFTFAARVFVDGDGHITCAQLHARCERHPCGFHVTRLGMNNTEEESSSAAHVLHAKLCVLQVKLEGNMLGHSVSKQALRGTLQGVCSHLQIWPGFALGYVTPRHDVTRNQHDLQMLNRTAPNDVVVGKSTRRFSLHSTRRSSFTFSFTYVGPPAVRVLLAHRREVAPVHEPRE
jgi:hypothetical protein